MKRGFARLVLWLIGWRAEGQRPEASHCVVVAAPHTSNWDFPLLIAFAWSFELPIAYVAKHTLFRGAMGPIMRYLGGVSVRRDTRSGLSAQLAETLKGGPPRAVVIPVEGSRTKKPHWRSGFYHVARAAGVPIVLSFLDYRRKVGGFGPSLVPTGNPGADMDAIRAFYADKTARHPELVGPVRLSEEV